jgi:hypothetical protein
VKSLVLTFVSLFASASFAASLPKTQFICKSATAGLIVRTIPDSRSIQVYNTAGHLVKNYPDVVPSYSYNDTLNPMFIDVTLVHGVTGKTVLFISNQANKITAIYNGDYSYTCVSK